MSEATSLEARWAALYEGSRPLLYRAAALMVGAAEAEEVVQEAFERAMRSRNFFDEVREPIAWLRTVCARQALGRLRRRRVWERVRVRLTVVESTEPWERAALAIALRKLPARDRVALVLRYYQDASYEEISSALGVSPASVGPMLTRARAKVREAMT
ncbi:MAG TPA: sigma-70 family RNA polymerase sigma factor [Candidatus Bathyarchaeia archaeon]|nr:sigma-70 family RNA polymerase sigma factor [Candidatus Bathyarchaeia archaeon]